MNEKANNDAGAVSGQDSFLDIVANMVGILIILVLVVGLRVRAAPQAAEAEAKAAKQEVAESLKDDHQAALATLAMPEVCPKAEQKDAAAELAKKQDLKKQIEATKAEEMELTAKFLKKKQQFVELEQSRLANEKAVVIMNDIVVKARMQVDEKKLNFSEEKRKNLELQEILRKAQKEEQELRNNLQLAKSEKEYEKRVIENHPSPIGKVLAKDNEVAFRILDGRIAYVPQKELFDRLKEVYDTKARMLRDRVEYTGFIPPIHNFRLQYTLQRYTDGAGMLGYGMSYCEFQPVGQNLGEPVEEALANPNSTFRRILAARPPGRYPITLWTYAGSFDKFEEVKKFLMAQKYRIAGRPLTKGMPIAASPHGSRSIAQ